MYCEIICILELILKTKAIILNTRKGNRQEKKKTNSVRKEGKNMPKRKFMRSRN